jgi:hypothetical protein
MLLKGRNLSSIALYKTYLKISRDYPFKEFFKIQNLLDKCRARDVLLYFISKGLFYVKNF